MAEIQKIYKKAKMQRIKVFILFSWSYHAGTGELS